MTFGTGSCLSAPELGDRDIRGLCEQIHGCVSVGAVQLMDGAMVSTGEPHELSKLVLLLSKKVQDSTQVGGHVDATLAECCVAVVCVAYRASGAAPKPVRESQPAASSQSRCCGYIAGCWGSESLSSVGNRRH